MCNLHCGSFVAVGGLSSLAACGILVPLPGLEFASPALEGRFLTTGLPGKSHQFSCLLPSITSDVKSKVIQITAASCVQFFSGCFNDIFFVSNFQKFGVKYPHVGFFFFAFFFFVFISCLGLELDSVNL